MSVIGLGRIKELLLPENQPVKGIINQKEFKLPSAFKQDSLNISAKSKNEPEAIFGRPENLTPVSDFVKNTNGNFTLNGKPFKFIGTNMYSLANEDSKTTEKMIQDAANEGFTTIRFWADKTSVSKLGEMCDLAKRYNVKLIPVLANQFHISASGNKDDYWYKEGYKKDYLPHLKELALFAKNRPEIMMWDLINEPATEKFENVYNFSKDVSAIIDSIDKNHLITIGTIGGVGDKFDSVLSMVSTANFKKLYSIPTLDAVSIHDYSYDARILERLDIFSRNSGDKDAAKRYNTLDKFFSFIPNKIDNYILDTFNTRIYNPLSLGGLWNSQNEKDIKIARDLKKPIFWGEVGFKKSHGEDRKKILDVDISKKISEGVQGYMLWSFEAQGHSIDGHDYGFTSKDGFSPVIKKWNSSFSLTSKSP